MRKIVFILAALFFSQQQWAQTAMRWQQIYGGPGIEVSYGVRTCLSPGYVSVGTSSTSGPTDGYIFMTDTLGVVDWAKFYGGNNIDVFRAIEVLPDSGFIVAGFTNSFGNGGYDGWLLRMTKNGDTLWTRTCGTNDWDFFYDVEYTSDSGFICAGGTYGMGNGDEDMFLVKFDKNGDSLWTRTYGGVQQDEARGVIETEDSLLALCGFTYSLADTLGESWLLRLDSAGNVIWSQTLGDSTAEDKAYGLHYDPVGDILIYCGYSMKTGNGDAYWRGVFYSGAAWTRVDHVGANFEEYTAVRVKPGLVSIATNGTTFTYGGGNGDMLFFASPNWFFASFGTIEEDHGYDVDFGYGGGYILSGCTVGYNSIVDNAYLIRLDTIYQTAPTVDVIAHEPEIQMNLFPVPAGNELFLQIGNNGETNDDYSIIVTDVAGRSIPVQSQAMATNSNSQTIRIVTSDLPDGIYFLSLTAKGQVLMSSKFAIAK